MVPSCTLSFCERAFFSVFCVGGVSVCVGRRVFLTMAARVKGGARKINQHQPVSEHTGWDLAQPRTLRSLPISLPSYPDLSLN